MSPVALSGSPNRAFRVAFQGERGAFSEDAVAMLWPTAESLPLRDFVDVTTAVSNGAADAGVLPIENSIFGSVDAVQDAIAYAANIFVVAEMVLNIRQCLMGTSDATLDSIEAVESHPVALAQCSRFLSRLTNVRGQAVSDTAGAARVVAEARDPRRAAIANARAAEIYGLKILADHVEDNADNRTRFLGIALEPATIDLDIPARTSFAFTLTNESGALLRVLEPIASQQLNLSRLDSRPGDHPWTYRFSADIDHPAGDPRIDRAMTLIRQATPTCRILGTYARAIS